MKSKMTPLTESFPSSLPTAVNYGSGAYSPLGSPGSMPSYGCFDSNRVYDGYKAFRVLYPTCIKCLKRGISFFKSFNSRSSKCNHHYVGKKPCQHSGVPILTLRITRANVASIVGDLIQAEQDKSQAQVKPKSRKCGAHLTLWSCTKSCDIQQYWFRCAFN
ncbi:hypothetical protein O181_069630 [Austropuccinia psidii MF-1]|uniref:Uncharacterized protein n=1 Tax=Austropuccinia psidii MF-1 TaxID=1389203 RepID=A0A9Q3I897_9BASI|nr:hypothetical protein [Austropuccinia psidii MF-1]